MRSTLALVTLAGALACGCFGPARADEPPAGTAPPAADSKAPAPTPVVEVAILLDTSNSMDGLIDQARSRLWAIVNTIALAKENGRSPDLRVALFEYGNQGLSPESGWIR